MKRRRNPTATVTVRTVPVKATTDLTARHPAPNGEHVNTDVVKGWVKEYWAHEEQPQSGETPPERKTRIEALKAERTPGHHGKTCISALRQTTSVTEFFRLEAKHQAATQPQDWHPKLTVDGQTLPRSTLAFPPRSSYSGGDWPEDFVTVVQPRQQSDLDVEDAPLTAYEENEAIVAAARLALHTASDGDAPQSRPRRDVTSAYQR